MSASSLPDLASLTPRRVDLVDHQRRQVGDDKEIGEPAGGDRTDLALQSEMLGGVEGGHLDRRHGLQPLRDGVAHDAVHVAFMDQRTGMAVVGAQDEVARDRCPPPSPP